MSGGSFCGAFNAAALKALTDRTGYALIQQNGQRKYGPPPNWNGPAPTKCEVFIGKIPRDLYEDDLVPVLEKAGRIYELRLMMDFSNHNRGYAFCTYTNKDEAMQAIRILNNYEIRPGRMIGVCLSIDNCRLFVGGIPKNRTREETMHEMSQITEGVVDCIMYPSAADKTKNRGFAFIEYESHRAAAMARRKLIPGKILLWGQQIAVDWAEPEAQVDDEVMKSVKILYLRGLMLTTKEEKLEEMISKMFDHKAVERVKKIRDFAFVHFYNREDAERAFDELNGTNIEGVEIEVTWAKPPDKDQIRYTKGNHKPVPPLPIQPNFFESGGTPFVGDSGFRQSISMPYMGTPPGSINAASNQVFGYPSGGSSSTGSIPSAGRMIGKGSAGMKGAGVKSQYNRMIQQQQQQQQMAAVAAAMQRANTLPNVMQSTPQQAPPTIMSPASMGQPVMFKKPHEILEDICSKNGWGAPVYTFCKSNAPVGGLPQFCCRVQIIMPKEQDGTVGMVYFQSPRLCATMEEAKASAAEHTLSNMTLANKDHLAVFASPQMNGAAAAGYAADSQRKALMNGGDGGMGAAAAAAAAQNQVTYVNQLSIQLAAAAAGLSFPNPAVALLGGPGALEGNKY